MHVQTFQIQMQIKILLQEFKRNMYFFKATKAGKKMKENK